MVHALRRGKAGLSRQGLDTELVRFHRPRVRTLRARIRDQGGGAQHQRLKQRRSGLISSHRREPALDSAIQWIVIALLVMRPMRQTRAFPARSEEHTSELQSLMRISYAVFCLKKKIKHIQNKYI